MCGSPASARLKFTCWAKWADSCRCPTRFLTGSMRTCPCAWRRQLRKKKRCSPRIYKRAPMNDIHLAHTVLPFPAERQVIVEGGRIAAHRHTVRGLIEVDVTEPRRLMQAHK